VGTLFSIELNERVYTLKAADGDETKKWVEVLNQLKVEREGLRKGRGGREE